MKACRNPVNKEDALSIRKQCKILSVNRSSIYYAPVGESEENPEIMRKIDEHYLDHPTEGVHSCTGFFVCIRFCSQSQKGSQTASSDGIDGDISKKESE
jgi:hypothetical protein